MARRKRGRDVHGILLLNKPLGITSNQALQRVKRLFNANKAGHTGALDPLATGLLPICLGEATKFSQLLLDSDKAYETTARFGEIRTTGDLEGDVLKRFPVPELSETLLDGVIQRFIGDVEQLPPLFSALKLDGKPLHELARQGLAPEEAAAIAEKKRRIIRIHAIERCEIRPSEMDLVVHCSKGTYIRTLVEDIGQDVGCGACVSRLHRIKTGPFGADVMFTLEQLEALSEATEFSQLDSLLLAPESAIPDWPRVELVKEDAERIRHGQAVRTGLEDQPSVQLWACDSSGGQLMGIGRIEKGILRSTRLLNL